jgi:hypothetical protein
MKVDHRREGSFLDLPKTALALNRVPLSLPSHRQDVFSFLSNFKFSKIDGKGPYQSPTVAADHSQQSTSAESNKPLVLSGNKPLLPPEEATYLKQYGRELFDDMVENEYKAQFNSLLTNQVKITRQLRAAVIDWLFEVGNKINIEDKQVLFQAVNLMDRFYTAQQHSLPSKDL